MSREPHTSGNMPDSEDIRAYVLEKLAELAVIAQSSALTILAEKIREAAGVQPSEDQADKPSKTREAG